MCCERESSPHPRDRNAPAPRRDDEGGIGGTSAADGRRTGELPRIIDEYANDAIARFGAGATFAARDHAWVMEHAATSLEEIETATLRLVALRMGDSVNSAATRLGMSHAALSRWMKRRQLPLKLG